MAGALVGGIIFDLDRDDPPLYCVADQLRDVVKGEFVHDIGAVSLHCLDCDSQSLGHLSVLITLRDQLHDLALSLCQFPRADGQGEDFSV